MINVLIIWALLTVVTFQHNEYKMWRESNPPGYMKWLKSLFTKP
jgi:hypothetical protein